MTAVSYKIEETKEPGFSTIAVFDDEGKKRFLHSSIAPSKESDILTDILEKGEGRTVIILGCGLGYHLKPLERYCTKGKIIIIDILEGIDTLVRKNVSLPSSTVFITGNDLEKIETEIVSTVDINEKTGFTICEHPSSIRLFPAFYKECRKILDRVIREKVGNLATKRKFGSIYIRNIAKTISSLSSAYPFSTLYNIFSETPAIVVSSSPSIDLFLPLIRENAENAVIFCVDSAYPILSANGILPDFIVTIDPQPWISEHLLTLDSSIPVLQAFSAWPLSNGKTPRFLSLTSHPLCQILEHHFPDMIGSFDSRTGTVAGDAILAAVKMGCSPIYAAGIDLSFPDMNIYSKDSRYNTRFTGFLNSRTKPIESLHMAYIQNSSKKTIFEKIRTRQSFLHYRDKLTSLVQTIPSPFIHLRGKGLSLDNVQSAFHVSQNKQQVKKDQLINNLSTLSTFGSLIDLSSLPSIFSSPLVSEAIREADGKFTEKEEVSFFNISFPKGV